jgi:AraC family transcriptional regulator, positive regulator of tynA and feaB
MQTIFSTARVHPRERFDYWHEIACKTIINHESIPECRQTFRAELLSGAFADIGLVAFENAPMAVTHSVRHSEGEHENAGKLFVCYQVAGTATLAQNGRQVELKPNDFTLLDPRAPYHARFFTNSKILILKIQRGAVEARLGKTRNMTARSIKSDSIETRMASAFLSLLPTHEGGGSRTTEEILQNQLLDLLALSLSNALDGRTPRISSARSLVAMQVRATIDARLNERELDPTAIAAGAGVSVRYAQAVLAEEGTSIMRLIQTRRLERCRQALEDPAQRHRTVGEIAYAWGFSDMTHFGRKFRAVFGVLPTEYRKSRKAAMIDPALAR